MRLENEIKSDKFDKIPHVSAEQGVAYWLTLSSEGPLTQKERNTTKDAKRRFLAIIERSAGALSVTQMSRMAQISRDTYYRWVEEDENFKAAISFIEQYRNMYVEDLLWKKIIVDEDGACIRYYLSHRHPDYMPHSQRTIFR